MTRFAILILFWIAFASSAIADPRHWMKQKDPDNLGLYVSASTNCPVSHDELRERIEGEFLRSRIKPSKNLSLNLTVNMTCIATENIGGTKTGYSIGYGIRYGSQMPNGANVLYEGPDYGGILVAGPDSKQYIIDAIRDAASLALTDYLKANIE